MHGRNVRCKLRPNCYILGYKTQQRLIERYNRRPFVTFSFSEKHDDSDAASRRIYLGFC